MIDVVAAVIRNDKNEILITKRNLKKDQGGFWEFPGGKVEKDEKREDAIVREIKEELDVDIEVKRYICEKTHIYPEKTINLIAFECKIMNEEKIKLLEHEDAKFVSDSDLLKYNFAPADKYIVENIIR